MKSLTRLFIVFCGCNALALIAYAGPEALPSDKEMKQVAPAPLPECNWTGFYLGINAGGQFGHSEDKDLDIYWGRHDKPGEWGYSESGVIAGGQVGYNFQWNWLVLGVEGDLGYMDLNGHGIEPWSGSPPAGPNNGASSSDFYTTIRGRLGVAFGHWLFYGTGGGIGVNYETKDYDPGEDFYGRKQDFDWGWTGGGGIEYMLGCHWSIKTEYLRYELDKQRFTGSSPTYQPGTSFRFDGNTEGNIIRAGLNFHF